jgi:hypothetical protein
VSSFSKLLYHLSFHNYDDDDGDGGGGDDDDDDDNNNNNNNNKTANTVYNIFITTMKIFLLK